MAGIINSIANAWFDWQSSMLWQTAVLIGVVAGIDRLIRTRAWPQLRYMLWLLVFVKLVLPPGLTSPWSVTSQVPALTQQAVELGMQNPKPPAVAPATQPLPVEPAAATATGTPSNAEPLAAALPRTESAVSQPAQAESEPWSWTVYAMAVWLAGVAALASGLCIRLRRLSKEHDGSRPADVPSWFDELLTQTAKEMGLRRAPRVVFSERVCCPAVFGVFRPILLFPADRLPITRQETRHILLHELAHIKRGDLLVHAAYMVLATIYWFNPLLWVIRKHVQNLRELCCDATVAAYLREETAGYRETLLATGRALLAQPVDPGLGLLGLFENSGWLPIRLQWLQKQTWRYPWLRRASVATVAILMFCCILPMASIDAANKTASSEKFKVTLPNGITVELVGVRKPETNQWWRPDGTPLAEVPYDSSEGDPQHQNPYEFAVHFENLPEGVTGGVRINPSGGGCGGTIPETTDTLKPHKAGKPVENMAYTVVDQDPKTETVTVRVDLATGEWKTEMPGMVNLGTSGPLSYEMWPSSTLNAIVGPAMPYESNGRVYAKLFYACGDPREQKYDARFTITDANNVEHQPVGGSGGGWYYNSHIDKALVGGENEFDLRLKDARHVNLQTRSHTWIEFKNVSLRPGETQKVEIVTTTPDGSVIVGGSQPSAAADSRTSSRATDQEFKATLPYGGTIELIGSRKTGTNQWCRPDGTPLAEAPYDASEETDRSDAYEVAVRYTGLPEGSVGTIVVPGRFLRGDIPIGGNKPQKAGKPVEGITYIVASPKTGLEGITVTVYLVRGDWMTDRIYWRPSNGWDMDTGGSPTLGAVVFCAPEERDGRTCAQAVFAANASHDADDVRLTAWDITNTERPPVFVGEGWSAAGLATTHAEFDVPLDDIVGFGLQSRLSTRIEFKNVTLLAGAPRKVEIVTAEVNRPVITEAKKQTEDPEGFTSWRDYSTQVLQAFHTSCTDYLNEHPGSELPRKPWTLKFKFPKQIFFDGKYQDLGVYYLQYIAWGGYFRNGGFPSLQREDFESSDASRTPILYCKTLLEREDGKGTNVLYGDGHIEYVTADQLDRLKAATPSGR